jgi:tetratricopeptide (TPR) repeat protein
MVASSSKEFAPRNKFKEIYLMLTALFISIILAFFNPFAAQSSNTIEGRVAGPDHRPLQNLRVTLQDGNYSEITSTITDAAGRFRFSGIGRGNYNIQVEPGRLPYERQTQRLEVNPISGRRAGPGGMGGGGEIFRLDFTLRSGNTSSTVEPAGTVFIQPVPESAKKEYSNAIKSLEKESFDQAAGSLSRAIELFPEYYDALELLGTEYVKRKDYKQAAPLLARAVEVNKDGWRGFYSLGIAYSELGRHTESVQALKRAAELNPNSANAHMRLGMELAKSEQTRTEAIDSLKRVTQIAGNSVPQVYWYLGALYNKAGQWREAADAFDAFLKAAPDAAERDKIKLMIKQLRDKAKS